MKVLTCVQNAVLFGERRRNVTSFLEVLRGLDATFQHSSEVYKRLTYKQ